MKFRTMRYKFRMAHLEAAFWFVAIVALALTNPVNDHASLCPAKALNIGFCPGCGLGTSISWLFRGQISESFASHPMGILAVIILSFRVFKLLQKDITFKPKNYEQNTTTTAGS